MISVAPSSAKRRAVSPPMPTLARQKRDLALQSSGHESL
jgi:hypothetical protein